MMVCYQYDETRIRGIQGWFNKKNLMTVRDLRGMRERITPKTYRKRLDKDKRNIGSLLDEWGRMYTPDEMTNVTVSNFVNGDQYGGLWNLDSHEIYENWKKRIQSMRYVFREDIETLVNDSKETNFFFGKGGKNPLLLEYVNRKIVTLETFIILNQLYNLFDKYDKELYDPRWEKLKLLCEKYLVFLNINYDEYKKEMLDISKKL